MHIQWYPGHMTKTRRMMQANLSLVDMVIELLDARVPYSSKNPDMDELARHKRRLILLNKADLANPSATKAWEAFYQEKGFHTVALNTLEGKAASKLYDATRHIMAEKIAKEKARGRLQVLVRAMVVGIPNVGKSTFINKLAGGAPALAADRPGVTRGKQWIKVKSDFDVLDTPGVLWPKFEDQDVAKRLAYTGAITDPILDTITLSEHLAEWFANHQPGALRARYRIPTEDLPPRVLLEAIGAARGFKIKGGEIDLPRTAATLLDEFRGGKLGRVTLEMP